MTSISSQRTPADAAPGAALGASSIWLVDGAACKFASLTSTAPREQGGDGHPFSADSRFWVFCTLRLTLRSSLGCLQREKIRNLDGNKIDGGCCGDFCSNFCCPCCAVIQQYKEVESRRDRNKINRDGYKHQPGMHY